MAARDNAFEYTENKYLTRREISNEIGVKITDEMFNRILAYRSSFYSKFPLKDDDNTSFYVCLCPSIANNLSLIKARLSKLGESFLHLNETSGDKQHFRLTVDTEILTYVAALRNINIDQARIKRLITSENPYDEDEEGLLNYLAALKYIGEHTNDEVDDNYLADLYSLLTGNPELTSFYRMRDVEDNDYRALVGRIYNHASYLSVEKLMNDLFKYINEGKDDLMAKTLMTYFYVLYVHPFEKYNDEIAILLAKAALSHSEYKEVGALFVLEKLFSNKLDYVKKNYQEIMVTGDVTYFIAPALPVFEKQASSMLDLLNDYSIEELRNDFYQEDIEEPVKEEKVEVVEPIIEEKQEEVIKDKEIEVKVEEKVEEEPQKEDNEEAEDENFEFIPVELIPNKIDEKEARRLQEHLLELDYRLKKHEAYFFARHHSVGSYYTIEQYKKCIKCVYETARTSMEHLVELGYYEKKKVGKKFVYTPRKRK